MLGFRAPAAVPVDGFVVECEPELRLPLLHAAAISTVAATAATPLGMFRMRFVRIALVYRGRMLG